MDFDGNLKEIPNFNNKDYGIQFLNPLINYAVIKLEYDQTTNDKRYNCLLSESKINNNMTSIFEIINKFK